MVGVGTKANGRINEAVDNILGFRVWGFRVQGLGFGGRALERN